MKKIPNLILLGNLEVKRLPIFSFLIKNEMTGLYLHHNFVAKLLNDLFGIQTRSGCVCAGPYAQYLLGVSEELAEKYLTSLYHENEYSPRKDWESNYIEILKPGFTRFNLPFFFDETRIDYVLDAIKFVTEFGWKFLPQYSFDENTAKFTHVLNCRQTKIQLEKKLNIDAYLNRISINESKIKTEVNLKFYLDEAKKLAKLDIFYEMLSLVC